MERGNDVVERWSELVDSVVSLFETAVAWFQQQVEATVRDKVAKPLVVAVVVALSGGAALASFTFTSVALVLVGLSWALGYVVGPAYGALIVGLVFVLGSVGVVYAVVRTVRSR
ncbi:MAG: hypothetical protein IBX62_04140 [Coriobacteriia bacterium]|nr:hypothetical protein [Coriobacteriia bacterium]